MKYRSIFTFIAVVFIATSVWAGELDEHQSRPAQPIQIEQLRFMPTNISEVSIDMPVYPGASAVSSDAVVQGAFGIDTQIFQTNTPFEKVVKFYHSRLGKQAVMINEQIVEGKRIKHFMFVSGSKSKNILIEDVDSKTSRITFTSFEGGGGFPTLTQ